MFQYHIDVEVGGVFVRHHGEFLGAESIDAVVKVASDLSLRSSDLSRRSSDLSRRSSDLSRRSSDLSRRSSDIRFIWFDASEVTSVSLRNTDSAYAAFAASELAILGTLNEQVNLVRVLDPKGGAFDALLRRIEVNSMKVTKLAPERPNLLVEPDLKANIPTYLSEERARKAIGLSDDYNINWDLCA